MEGENGRKKNISENAMETSSPPRSRNMLFYGEMRYIWQWLDTSTCNRVQTGELPMLTRRIQPNNNKKWKSGGWYTREFFYLEKKPLPK